MKVYGSSRQGAHDKRSAQDTSDKRTTHSKRGEQSKQGAHDKRSAQDTRDKRATYSKRSEQSKRGAQNKRSTQDTRDKRSTRGTRSELPRSRSSKASRGGVPKAREKAPSLTWKQRMQIRIREVGVLPWYFAVSIAVLLFLASHLFSIRLNTYSYKADENTDALLRMDFVGDVSLSRNIISLGESSGYKKIFSKVKDFWGDADLVFANLESAVLKRDESAYEKSEKALHLYADYEALNSALDAGINVLACANNHSFDYGEAALLELVDYLDTEGVTYSGIGRDLSEAADYEIIECGDLKIAFLSISEVFFNYSSATESQGGILSVAYTDYNRLVYLASREADLTVVYIHWGEENEIAANEEQKTLGHQLIDAGADIVIGSHPHVLQEVEMYDDGIIFYSLGNFVFDQGNTYARDSVMVEYTAQQDGTGEFRLYPVRISDGAPAVTTGSFYKSRINRELSQGLTESSYYLDEDGFIVIPFDILSD